MQLSSSNYLVLGWRLTSKETIAAINTYALFEINGTTER